MYLTFCLCALILRIFQVNEKRYKGCLKKGWISLLLVTIGMDLQLRLSYIFTDLYAFLKTRALDWTTRCTQRYSKSVGSGSTCEPLQQQATDSFEEGVRKLDFVLAGMVAVKTRITYTPLSGWVSMTVSFNWMNDGNDENQGDSLHIGYCNIVPLSRSW